MPATTTPQLKEGRYNIEQEFVSGKDRSIFQAYDIKSEKPVTVAEIPVRLPKVATISQRDAVAAAFAEQVNALSVFKHRSALAVRDHLVEAGRHYLVCDPMDGVDLATVLADQDRPFSVPEITSWADTLLDVLNSLHICRPPFVYKHFRPDCVIQRADRSVAVALWGMLDLNSGLSGAADAANDEQSSIAYSPLEQIWSGLDAASQKVIVSKLDEASERTLKQPLDARSDIYSLGAVLYHLITGRSPVDALERSIEMIEGGPDPLKAPSKVDPSIPTEISDVIMKAMDIRREYRFDSAAIMRQVMRTAVVRVKEREEEERREEEEVLKDLRSAQAGLLSSRTADTNPAVQPAEPQPAQPKANAKAADAPSQSNPPRTDRTTETFEIADLDDDLLGLLSDTSTPPNPIHVSSPAETKRAVDSTDQQLPDSTNNSDTAARNLTPGKPADDAVSVVDGSPVRSDNAADDEKELTSSALSNAKPVEREAAPEIGNDYTTVEPDLFPVEKTSSRGVMVAAAVVVVVCLTAVGGWMYFGSAPNASTTNAVAPPPAAMTQTQVESPVVTDPQPSHSPELTAAPAPSPENGSAVEGETPIDQQPQKVAASSTQRPRKQSPAPPRTPAPKKPVTVDDLINDN